MPEVKRNEIEIEMDRAYISGIVQHAGPDVSAVYVWRLLNKKREERARKAARDAGKTPEDVEEAATFARVSVWAVRRDLASLKSRAQEAGLVGAALFLDDQIAAVRDEIQQTHEMDEAIMLDLERSRGESWTRTRGKKGEGGKIEPNEVVRHKVEDGAANAALYGRLQENARRRAELRAEERLLRFGRQTVPEPTIEEEMSFTELVMELDDPVKARGAALRLLRRELRDLETASRAPLSGDMLQLERMRVQQLEVRIRNLRDYIRLPDGEEGEASSFEVSYQEIPVRQLPAAPIVEREENDAP